MPEYLAPGVYVEETSFRSKSIEGVGTSTTAFAGPTRKGPLAVAGAPLELLTSFGDFERVYGGLEDLQFGDQRMLNYLAHSVFHFFNEGGSRLYVARVIGADAGVAATPNLGQADAERVVVRARFGGAGGNGRLVVSENLRPIAADRLNLPPDGSVLRLAPEQGNPAFFVRATIDGNRVWHVPGAPDNRLNPADIGDRATHLISVNAEFIEESGASIFYEDLALGRAHARFAGTLLPQNPSTRTEALNQPVWFDLGANVDAGELLRGLFPDGSRVEDGRRVAEHRLTGGTDGTAAPANADYNAAFEALRGLEDVSIVAAPGHSDYDDGPAIRGALIAHAERPRAYRIAVLDSEPQQLPGGVQAYRGQFDSHRAALYYPWVTVSNPLARPGRDDQPREINLPPSGFICGIYARNDAVQGVSKAPANEVVRGALRFETEINHAQNQLLNPLGVNCLRFFPGRGYRVWGARTASSDPEWKYVNVRRFFLYLEASIDRGTQWAVFENNGPRLWANIRETIEAFLYNEWVSGNLLGDSVKEAYFVRCDRSTMTQNDLDNGRLICLIGVAALKPAEFVIFRIGQKTADSRS